MLFRLAVWAALLFSLAHARDEPNRAEVLALLQRRVPAGVPADFECAWRALALEFAAEIQPARPAAALAAISDALQLQTLCNASYAPPARPPLPPHNTAPPSTLYVDAALGDDANAGTQASPLAHVATAVSRARALPQPATVILRGGAPHRLAATLQLSAADSGLTIVNFPGEEPVITGGLLLNTSWEAAALLNARSDNSCSLLPGENAMFGEWPSPGIVNGSAFPDAASCNLRVPRTRRAALPLFTTTVPAPTGQRGAACASSAQTGVSTSRPRLPSRLARAHPRRSRVTSLSLISQTEARPSLRH